MWLLRLSLSQGICILAYKGRKLLGERDERLILEFQVRASMCGRFFYFLWGKGVLSGQVPVPHTDPAAPMAGPLGGEWQGEKHAIQDKQLCPDLAKLPFTVFQRGTF